MTEKRKDELLNSALGWICEHISDDEELYNSLHNVIGFTDDEIEESGIDFLYEFFTDNDEVAENDKPFRIGGL